jgi:WD40 repeat protein
VLALAQGALAPSALPRVCVVVLMLLALGGLALAIGPSPVPPAEVRKAAPPPADEPRPLVDRHGDPLPEGALARLGTVRLRQSAPVSQGVLARDGKTLVTAGHDGIVRLFDARDGKQLRDFAVHAHPYSIALSADAKQVACSTNARGVQIYDARTGKQLQSLPLAKGQQAENPFFYSLAFSPDGTILAGITDNKTHVWKLSDGQLLHELPSEDRYGLFHSICFSDDGKRLGIGGAEPRVWDVTTGKVVARFADRKVRAYCATLSGDGKTLAVGYEDGRIYLYNTRTGKADHVLPGHEHHSNVNALAFSGDGKALFSVGLSDQSLRQWDVESGKQALTLPIETYDGLNVTVSKDGKTLAAVGNNYVAHVWHAKKSDKGGPAWQALSVAEAHQSLVTMLGFSADSKTLASAGPFGPARLWDVPSGKQVAVRGGQADRILRLACSSDGKSLVLVGSDFAVRWCDPRTAEVRLSRRWTAESLPQAIGFRDGKTLMAGFSGEKLHLAQMDPQEKPRSLEGHEKCISRVGFSSDGRVLASASFQNPTVFVWDAATGRRLHKIEAHVSDAMAVSDRFLAVESGQVDVYELATAKRLVRLDKGEGRVTAMAFSPDGRWLATAEKDRLIRVWETATWKPVARFRGHGAEVEALAISPDGRVLASGSADTSILLWDLTDRFAEGARQRLTPRRLDDLWADLGGEDAWKARLAVWALARSPKESVPFLIGRVGARKADPKRIDKLIADLDDDDSDVRVRATRELQSLGWSAAPAMRKALKTTESAEVKLRLLVSLGLLDSEEGRLRRLRGLVALEYAGTPEAREALKAVEKE